MIKGYYVVFENGTYVVEEDTFKDDKDFMECQRRIFNERLYLGRYFFLTKLKSLANREASNQNQMLEKSGQPY